MKEKAGYKEQGFEKKGFYLMVLTSSFDWLANHKDSQKKRHSSFKSEQISRGKQ